MGLRISGGAWRGVAIESAPKSRPTQERVRQALFNRWSGSIEGARFLDLFCGGGAVGLEALSRGARSCSFVDRDRGALSALRRNLAGRDANDRSLVFRSEGGERGFLPSLDRLGCFDLVFADPPYNFELWPQLLESAANRLVSGGELVIEHSARVELPPPAVLTFVDARSYGDSTLARYRALGPSAGLQRPDKAGAETPSEDRS